jgi:hypothetical protein
MARSIPAIELQSSGAVHAKNEQMTPGRVSRSVRSTAQSRHWIFPSSSPAAALAPGRHSRQASGQRARTAGIGGAVLHPSFFLGSPRDLGLALPKDLRQRGVAVEDALVEARQGREAGALPGHVHNPPLCHAEPGFAERGLELLRRHLRFLLEGTHGAALKPATASTAARPASCATHRHRQA